MPAISKAVISQEGTRISAYGDGGFRLGDQKCKGSILITKRGYYPWVVVAAGQITRENLIQIIDHQQEIDILLVGTGEKMVFIPKDLTLAAEKIAVEVMATGAAARTYNILLAEGRKVAAALIAVA